MSFVYQLVINNQVRTDDVTSADVGLIICHRGRIFDDGRPVQPFL